ncbi:hypothetical protein ACWGID_16085 [Kribbella sp. NPDC054772]
MVEDDPWAVAESQRPASYDDLIGDPWKDREKKESIIADAILGGAAILLLQRGERDVAGLVLDVEKAVLEYDPEDRSQDLWLEVAPEDRPRFSSDVVDQIKDACVEVSRRKGYGVEWISVRESLPPVGPSWREQLREQLAGKKVSNQGRRVRVGPPRHIEDNLAFTNPGELKVYRALKHIQQKEMPTDETLSIAPLPGLRLRDHTWEPDLLIAYKGRAGIIEVDGPHHNRRRAFDGTRDHLYRDAGAAFVDRIPVEALDSHEELLAVLRRFLKRMSESR